MVSPDSYVKASLPGWFVLGEQQDSSEYLRFILDGIHEGLKAHNDTRGRLGFMLTWRVLRCKFLHLSPKETQPPFLYNVKIVLFSCKLSTGQANYSFSDTTPQLSTHLSG